MAEPALELVPVGDAEKVVGRRGDVHRHDPQIRDAMALAFRLGETGADDQAVQPGVESVWIAEARQVTPCGHQRFLQGVLGAIDVAEDALGKRVETVAAGADKVGKRLPISVPCREDKISVHELRPAWHPMGALSGHYGAEILPGVHSSFVGRESTLSHGAHVHPVLSFPLDGTGRGRHRRKGEASAKHPIPLFGDSHWGFAPSSSRRPQARRNAQGYRGTGATMSRHGPRVLAAINIALAVMLAGAAPLSTVRAQGEPDRSDVVLVLDFSASILDEPATRNRFGAALERIADRVEATSADLVAGDTTMTIIQFASKAANYGGCVDLRLLGSPGAVTQFARCLRSVASAYRKGLDPALSRKIGIDTNYVAAMELAAKHLPADAMRPALIMFTDGRHDVRGVPASQVKVTRDRLFASRAPFALLPVGMGLDPKKRNALESGLAGLRIVSDMPPCVSGQTFDWPKVVFETADEAGNAVAVALQDATCTFTLPPTSVVPPAPGVVRGIRLTARDRSIQLSWSPPAGTPVPVVGYRARCRADVGDWVEATVGASPSTTATIDGLTNGVAYRCEVAAVGSESDGAWTAALTAVIPLAVSYTHLTLPTIYSV